MSKNVAASIRARLKQHANASKQDFNLTLTRYGLERLLYRLSISAHAPNFLLKGALLFSLWYEQPHRPTRDVDLLGFGPDDVCSSVSAFRDICGIAVSDGVVFDAASVKGTETARKPAMAAFESIFSPSSMAHESRCKSTSASATLSPRRPKRSAIPCCSAGCLPRSCALIRSAP